MDDSRFRLKIGAQELELHVGELLVGRSEECGLCLDDERLSRVHSKFIVSKTQVELVDLGSRNGTYLNDNRVRERVVLKTGDRVRMGRTGMTLQYVGRRPRQSSHLGRTLGGATLLDMAPPNISEETDVLLRVLKLGRLDEAEKLLRGRVANLVRTDPPLAVDHVLSQNVLSAMLGMADKSMDARWIHRLFKLHITCQWWMPDDVQKRAEQLIRAIGRTGGDGLTAYVAHWAGRSNTLNDVRKQQLARLHDLAGRDSTVWSE